MIYIQYPTLYLPDQMIKTGAVLVNEARILAVGPEEKIHPPEGAQILNGGGLVLAPGLIDLQVNGGFGQDFTEKPESIWEVAAQLPRYGVTSFLPTIITSPQEKVRQALQVIRQGPPPGFKGAIPLGLHLEGPFLNPAKKGAHNTRYMLTPDLDVIADWSRENGVCLVTLAPELPGALELVHALRQRGVEVSAGHSAATYEEAEAGFAAGIIYGTHLFNAMPRLEHREPGLPGALLTHDDITIGLIADGIHTHPAIVQLAWKAKGAQRLTLVTDAMAALGMPPGEYLLGDYRVTVDATSARLVEGGSLAGSILTPDGALRNLMHFTGCSLGEALPTMTSTPAHLLGMKHKGQIAHNCDADLVLLTPDGHVRTTIVGGRVVYQAA